MSNFDFKLTKEKREKIKTFMLGVGVGCLCMSLYVTKKMLLSRDAVKDFNRMTEVFEDLQAECRDTLDYINNVEKNLGDLYDTTERLQDSLDSAIIGYSEW